MISRTTRSGHWSYFGKSHWILQHLSQYVEINRTRKTINALWNTTFVYREEFNKYIKVERATSEDIFDYLFNLGAERFLLEKEKKYLHELFEKWDPEHLENDENFNDGLEDNIEDESMQNLEDN